MRIPQLIKRVVDRYLNVRPPAPVARTDSPEEIRRYPPPGPADLSFWQDNGFLILKGFFPPDRCRQITDLLDRTWQDRQRADNPLVIDAFLDRPGGQRMYLRDAPDEARKHPYKLNDLFLELQPVREMVLDPLLCDYLRALLEGDPLICNSLNFEYGSQQGDHIDTFYMPPPVTNRLVVSWIALEPARADAGPLRYYPGSHKITPYLFSHGRLHSIEAEMPAFYEYIYAECGKLGIKPISFLAEPGDVFIWHAQLLHGGSHIESVGLTRRSLVTHYFRAQDFPASAMKAAGPGRYFLDRGHQPVP